MKRIELVMSKSNRRFNTSKAEGSLKEFYLKLYKQRIKKGYACKGIKKRLKQLGVITYECKTHKILIKPIWDL